ncbi:MAG: rny, partial [Anaerocolumna sp.]|nr:rny [Anaerocolumna sp.]
MQELIPVLISILVTLVIVAPLTWKFAISYRIKVVEAKIGSAEEKAREIIDEALKTAETKKREALLEAKE